MPSPANRCVEGIVSSVCPSAHAYVHLGAWTELHKALVDDVFEVIDELVRF